MILASIDLFDNEVEVLTAVDGQATVVGAGVASPDVECYVSQEGIQVHVAITAVEPGSRVKSGVVGW